ncbi:hypothetical protein H6G04_32455 [Calothrix membranacea FACHB-236]|nr:hypothetical protein [Calothrix membranacea FACHB-236]
MSQPLGYYCALTPGDGTYLDWLQDTYGSCLEGINRIEKLHFLKAITENLIATEIATQGQYLLSESADTIQKLQEDLYQYTPIGDHLGLAEAIINQLKTQQ